MRSDAIRNRARVLRAARQLFESISLDVPVEQIAKSAGLGVGTVYRHFPTKSALFEAVLQERIEELVASLEAPTAEDPVRVVLRFVQSALSHAGPKNDLVTALNTEGVQPSAELAALSGRLRGQLATLLERAQKAGGLRSDVDAGDLLAILSGASATASRPDVTPNRLTRITAVICDGLRADAGLSVESMIPRDQDTLTDRPDDGRRARSPRFGSTESSPS